MPYAQSVTPLYERALQIQQEVMAAAEEARRLEAAYVGAKEVQQAKRQGHSRSRSRSPRGSRSPPRAGSGAWSEGQQRSTTTRHARTGSSSTGSMRSSPRANTRLSSVHTMLRQATEGVRAPGAQVSTSLQLLGVAVRRAQACSEYMELASDHGSSEGRLLQRALRRLDALQARADERRQKLATARTKKGISTKSRPATCEGTRSLIHDLKETSRGLSYRPPSAEEVEEATHYRVVRGPAWPESWGVGPEVDDDADDDEMEDGNAGYQQCSSESSDETENKWDRLNRNTSSARLRQAPVLSPRAESRRRRQRGDFVGAGQVNPMGDRPKISDRPIKSTQTGKRNLRLEEREAPAGGCVWIHGHNDETSQRYASETSGSSGARGTRRGVLKERFALAPANSRLSGRAKAPAPVGADDPSPPDVAGWGGRATAHKTTGYARGEFAPTRASAGDRNVLIGTGVGNDGVGRSISRRGPKAESDKWYAWGGSEA